MEPSEDGSDSPPPPEHAGEESDRGASGGGGRPEPSARFSESLRTSRELYRRNDRERAIGEAFDAIDIGGSGHLSREEIVVYLEAAAHHVKLDVGRSVVHAAVDALVEDVSGGGGDDGGDDGITREQFFEMFERHPDLLTAFEDEESVRERKESVRKSAPTLEDLKEKLLENDQVWKHAGTHWKNRWVALTWLVLYLAANVVAFTYKAIKYAQNDEAQAVFGACICVARGAAQALNFNALVVLLPICRHFMTFLRSTRLRWIFPFDAQLEIHILVGIVIGLFSLAHFAAHICDFARFASAPEEDIYALFGNKLGPVPESKGERWALLLRTRAGITGLIMVVCIIAAYACIYFRRSKFNVFWYMHHLLLVMLVALCIHGTGSLLEGYQSVYWCCVPFALYFIPRFLRETSCSSMKVIEARIKPGAVAQLKLERPSHWDRRIQAGMYAFLNLPQVSRLEWHPFTLTSSPEDDFVEFHFAKAGDWTGKAHELIEKCGGDVEGISNEPSHPLVKVEGPIGASSQGFSDHPIIVLVGAGIGITPMISVLRMLLANPGQMRRTFFYWTVRDRESFEIFSGLMDDIYDSDQKNVLQIRHFLTSVKHDDRDLGAVLLKYAVRAKHRRSDMDLILGGQTHHQVETGRPDWDEELKSVRDEAKELGYDDCGIFLCGPGKMAEAVEASSLKLSLEDPDFHLYFSKETF